MDRPRQLGAGLVGLAIISVQLGSALATTILDEVGPLGAVLLRTIFGAAVLLLVLRPSRGLLRGEGRRDILVFGLLLSGMNLLFFAAIERLPLGIAVTLEFVGPLGVAILGSRRGRDLIWALLAGAGIVLLAPDIGDGLDGLGVLYALGAGACWGGYLIYSSRVVRGPAGRQGLALAMLVSTAILLVPGVVGGGTELLDPRILGIGVLLAMLGSAIPFTAEMEALRRLTPGTVGVLLSAEPAAAALIGFIALDQDLLTRELIAMALVIVASAGALRAAEPVAEPAHE